MARLPSSNRTKPFVGIILGSGLGDIAREVEEARVLSFRDIPRFPVPSVKGHLGEMVLGRMAGKEVCVLKGRAHLYEGYTMREITYPVTVMANLGIRMLLVTALAGGLREDFRKGDLAVVCDHINFMGDNPLIVKKRRPDGIDFVDLKGAYDRDLIRLALDCGNHLRIKVKKGVYVAVKGPCFETLAESEMFRRWGGDLVGMSVVPEVIVARQLGLKVLAVCCISNTIRKRSSCPATHDSNLEVAKRVIPKFSLLLREILERAC